jgi:hypothetical protein
MNDQQYRLQALRNIREVIKAGYAGMLLDGSIVDRRKFKYAAPVPFQTLLNVTVPLAKQV